MTPTWDEVGVWIRHAGLYPCHPRWRIAPTATIDEGFFYILRGHGWVDVDGGRLDAVPGDLFLLRRGQHFSAGHDPDDPVTVYSSAFRLLGPGAMDAFPRIPLPQRIRLPEASRRGVEERWAELVADFLERVPYADLAARGSLMRLVAEVLRLAEVLPAAHISGRSAAAPGVDTRAAKVLAHIDAHLAERLTLARLARIAGVSPVYFAKLFRRQTGLSPMDCVRQRRIEKAKALLAAGDDSIERVAQAVGFADPFHFSRLFRQVVGQAPSAYRQDFVDPFRG